LRQTAKAIAPGSKIKIEPTASEKEPRKD
jgi:hypothetical protein